MSTQSINRLTMTQFKKDILFKSEFHQFVITPYASQELSVYARVIVLSDQVEHITTVHIRNRRKPTAVIIPFKKGDNIHDIFKEHSSFLNSVTGVAAPYFGVFNLTKDTRSIIFEKPIFKIRVEA